jgi:uridine phosphorylase
MTRSAPPVEDNAVIHPSEHAAYVRATHGASHLNDVQGIVLVYQNSLLRRMLTGAQSQRLSKWVSGELYLLQRDAGTVGLCGGFGVGGPATALVAEQLIALGAGRIISVGTAGGLQRGVAIGEQVICTRAFRDEGVSRHYLSRGQYAYPSTLLTTSLRLHAGFSDGTIRAGTTWTIDAPYRETVNKVMRHNRAGTLTVEMEAASLFAVASHRQVEAAAAFVISDLVLPELRRPRDSPRTVPEALDQLAEAAIAALLA